jgi:hypothetical protein
MNDKYRYHNRSRDEEIFVEIDQNNAILAVANELNAIARELRRKNEIEIAKVVHTNTDDFFLAIKE